MSGEDSLSLGLVTGLALTGIPTEAEGRVSDRSRMRWARASSQLLPEITGLMAPAMGIARPSLVTPGAGAVGELMSTLR